MIWRMVFTSKPTPLASAKTSLMSSASARFSSSSRSMRSMKDFKRSPAMPPTSGMGPPRCFGLADPIEARAATQAAACSVFVRLLLVLLVLRLPFVVGHAIDDLARLGIGQREAALLGRLAIPPRQAIAAEAGEAHQIEVLHIGALAQMLHQAAKRRRFELGRGLVVHRSLRCGL